MNDATNLNQETQLQCVAQRYQCDYQCKGVYDDLNRIIDDFSAILIGFSPESLAIHWLEKVFTQSIELHISDSFEEFLQNKKFSFTWVEKDGVHYLNIANTTDSMYWYELRFTAID